MASVFKRKDKNGKRSQRWTIQYSDAHGKKRQRIGFTDKQESQRLANKMEEAAKLRRDGVIDLAAEVLAAQTKRPVSQHLSEFLDTIRSKGGTEKHVRLISARIEAVIKEAGIATPSEITRARIESAIGAIQKRNDLSPRTVNHYIQTIKEFVAWLVPHRLAANPLLDLELRNAEVDIRKKRRALTPDEVSRIVEAARSSSKDVQCYDGEQRARIYLLAYLTGLRKNEIASLTPESFQLDDETPTLTLEARDSKHRKKDVLPLHPQLVTLLRQWLPESAPEKPLFPKLSRRKGYVMIRKDLEAAGIPYTTKDGDADFHAVGRHTYITELLRNGTSLVVARELARHSDVTMTMRYTHIGLQDQAKAIENLPTDPKWLETGLPTEPMSQHICSTSQQICSKSGVSAGHSQSTKDTGCHSETAESGDTNPCDVSPSVTRRQKKAPPVTDGAQVEAAGIEPASRDTSKCASTCIVDDLNLVFPDSPRQDSGSTSRKLGFASSVPDMTRN